MFDAYKNRIAARGRNMSEMLRMQSNMVIEQTWDRDPNYRQVYVVKVDSGLPEVTVEHELIDVKFNVKTYSDIKSDEPSYWMQFRHGEEKRHPEIGIGSYIYMEDEDGEWKWWMIQHLDERPAFRQYQILECNYTFRWIADGKIYSCLGIQRIQQSYNSGSWDGDRFTFVDNITSAILPANNDTFTITYNHRFMITDPRRPTPLVWAVSKIEDSTPIGLITLKFTQETYSPTLDNRELMLCNYYSSEIVPEAPVLEPTFQPTAEITYSGAAPTIKVGGSYKVFTPVFSDESVTVDKWTVSDENGDITADTTNYIIEYDRDKLKLKVAQNYYLIGKVLTVQVIGTDKSTAEISVEVIG
jgi:hypothetical protein